MMEGPCRWCPSSSPSWQASWQSRGWTQVRLPGRGSWTAASAASLLYSGHNLTCNHDRCTRRRWRGPLQTAAVASPLCKVPPGDLRPRLLGCRCAAAALQPGMGAVGASDRRGRQQLRGPKRKSRAKPASKHRTAPHRVHTPDRSGPPAWAAAARAAAARGPWPQTIPASAAHAGLRGRAGGRAGASGR